MENIVCRGVNVDFKRHGAFYILGGLTMVNSEAATSLPWLYESFFEENII